MCRNTRAGGKLRGAVLLVNYAVALTLLNLFLILGQIDSVKYSPIACQSIGVIIHFSLLATFGWMLVEGAVFFLAVICVSGSTSVTTPDKNKLITTMNCCQYNVSIKVIEYAKQK